MAIPFLQSPTPFSFYEIPASRRSAFPRNDSARFHLKIRARGEILRSKTIASKFSIIPLRTSLSLLFCFRKKICILQIRARVEILREKTLASKHFHLYYNTKSKKTERFALGFLFFCLRTKIIRLFYRRFLQFPPFLRRLLRFRLLRRSF